jgi:hypothetical protein
LAHYDDILFFNEFTRATRHLNYARAGQSAAKNQPHPLVAGKSHAALMRGEYDNGIFRLP